jgi:O-antigen ligase
LDGVAITATLAAFTAALLNAEVSPGDTLAGAKWYFLVGFFLYCFSRSRGAFSSRSHVAILFFAGFVIAASVSTALSESVTLIAIQRVASFAILFAVAWLFPVPTHPELRVKVWTWSIATVVVIVVGLSLLCYSAPFAWENGRFRGVTGNANTLAGLSAIGLLLPMAVIRVRRYWLCGLAMVVASCICLALSQSRAAAIAAGGGVVCTLLIKKGRQSSLLMALAAIATATILAYSVHSILQDRIPSATLWRGFDLNSRSAVWQDQLDSWRRSPLVGHGLEPQLFANGIRPGTEGSYGHTLAVVGLLGAIPLFLGFLISFISLVCWVREREDSPYSRETFHIVAATLVTAIFINSAAEGYLVAVGNAQIIYAWVILAAGCELRVSRTLRNQLARRITLPASIQPK